MYKRQQLKNPRFDPKTDDGFTDLHVTTVLKDDSAAMPAVSPLAPMRGFAVALLALCALLLWALARRQPQREARRRLRSACRRGDAPGARAALADWWKAETRREAVPVLTRMGDDWDGAARAQLASLDAALYGGRTWDAKAFWRAVRRNLKRKPARRAAAAAGLPPLFRLQGRG